MKGFDIWVFMAFTASLLGLTPFFYEPLNPKESCALVSLSFNTKPCKTFKAFAMAFMESTRRGSFACWALTLAHSASNYNQAVYLANFLAL